MPEERWITLNEAAAISVFSHIHLRQLAQKGRLEAKKIGRDWFTTAEAVAEYENDHEKRSHDPYKYKERNNSHR